MATLMSTQTCRALGVAPARIRCCQSARVPVKAQATQQLEQTVVRFEMALVGKAAIRIATKSGLMQTAFISRDC